MTEEFLTEEAIWRFEPLTEFEPPSPPAQATARKKLALLFRRFNPSKENSAEAEDLERPPAALLDRAVPEPSREPFFKVVDEAVQRWRERKAQRKPILVFVLSAGEKCLSLDEWARTRDIEIAPTPSSEAILAGDPDSLPSFEGDGLLVIPELEGWLRRHHRSLGLMRELIGQLSRTERPCIVGLNSWAWRYLKTAAEVAVELPAPLTLAPFDATALSGWLADLAGEGVIFRRDDTGQLVLDPAADGSGSAQERKEGGRGDFMAILAAASRGNPWLAWQLFRGSMRVKPQNEAAGDEPDSARTVWVSPKFSLELPEMDKSTRAAALLIFHALLIHKELSMSDLESVLPPIRTFHVVHHLAQAGIFMLHENKWSVAPIAYPTVREALEHDGYPVDQL